MLSVTIAVNGIPVSQVHAYRSDVPMDEVGRFVYKFCSAQFPLDIGNDVITTKGTVLHKYDDGINVLVERILSKTKSKQ